MNNLFQHRLATTGPLRTAAAAALLVLVLVTTASGRTVNWGDSIFGTDLQSDGSDVDMTFTFELGTFGSFVPDETNIYLWSANWKVIDTGTYNGVTDLFTSTVQIDDHPTNMGEVVSSANPTETFLEGEQAYIWIYDTMTISTSMEWALITDNDGLNGDDWLLPDGGDQSTEPLNWRVSTATTPIYGGINDTTGPGTRTDMSTIFDFQTHTLPEPGTLMLVVGALGGLALRRTRHGEIRRINE